MPGDEKTVMMPPPDAVAIGTQLSGLYELDKRIAAGGMGEVFKGHNIQTDDPVAIKIVLPEFARDPVILALFRKEASILNHLSHEAIVRYHVFAIDQALGRPYLAMEFVDGVSLADMMAQGPMPPADARTLLYRVASGLAAAHEAGVIHRDLSPDNIILPGGKVGRAKIIDFGIARSANVGGETLLGGVFAGKYNFVSPEQLGMYGGEVSDRSDIYSLGLVMAAALRGAALNMSGSQVEVIEKRRAVPDLTGVDESLRPILEAMLQPNPEDRPEDMSEIADWVAPVRTARTFDTTARGAMPPSTTPPASESTVGQVSWDPTQLPGGAPSTSSTPPAPNQNWAVTQPPGGVSAGGAAPPGSALAQGTVIPAPPASPPPLPPEPASESPFGPYTGPANIPIPTPIAPAAPEPSRETRGRNKRGGIVAGIFAVLVAGVAAAVWYGGLVNIGDLTGGETGGGTTTGGETGGGTTTGGETGGGTTTGGETGGGTTTGGETGGGTTTGGETGGTTTGGETGGGTTTGGETGGGTTTGGETGGGTTTGGETGGGTTTGGETGGGTTTGGETGGGTTTGNETGGGKNTGGQIDAVAEQISWLRNYSGGNCFYATPTSINGTKAEIEGFGDSVDAFKSLLTEYQAKFNIEPDIQVRLIRPQQCEVTGFVGSLDNGTTNPPNLSLVKYELANRDPMSGEVQTAPDRETYLLLVDHDGIVHNLDALLTRSGDFARFNVALGLGTGTAQGAIPEVLVAVSSAKPLDGMSVAGPVSASDFFPKLLKEIEDKKIDAAATVKYLRIRG